MPAQGSLLRLKVKGRRALERMKMSASQRIGAEKADADLIRSMLNSAENVCLRCMLIREQRPKYLRIKVLH